MTSKALVTALATTQTKTVNIAQLYILCFSWSARASVRRDNDKDCLCLEEDFCTSHLPPLDMPTNTMNLKEKFDILQLVNHTNTLTR